MNSSKNNFLQRFNGKISYISKHGDVMNRPSFQDTRHNNRVNTLCSSDLGRPSKQFPAIPPNKLSCRDSVNKASRLNDRSQAASFHMKNTGMAQTGKENNLSNTNTYTKQKLVNVGANLLQSGFGKKKLQGMKANSLNWQIDDKETRDFYQQLQNLQQSKVFSYTHNPKVHL